MKHVEHFITLTLTLDLNKQAKRATAEIICLYKLSLLLYKTCNEAIPETEWIGLNSK
jgi:hypothetical protein